MSRPEEMMAPGAPNPTNPMGMGGMPMPMPMPMPQAPPPMPGMPGMGNTGLPGPEDLMATQGSLDSDVQALGQEEPLLRGEVVDWRGGKPINLKKKTRNGKPLNEVLSEHIGDILDQELKNHEKLVSNLKRWHERYRGERNTARPQDWMANVSIPIIRSDSDAIYVRELDALFNKRRIVLLNPVGDLSPDKRDMIYKWEKAINNYLLKDLNLREKLKFPLRQSVNTGTGVVKIVYETKNRTVYRYATPDETTFESVKKYRAPGTDSLLVKEEAVVFKGPNIYPIDRADFIISSDALSIDEAYMTGFRFYRRKSQLESFANAKIYDRDAVDRLDPDSYTELKEKRAGSAGQELNKNAYTEPYELWEIWTRYDCDGDGDEDDIVITFHAKSRTILKAIYNPIFYGYRPFVDIKSASQTEYTYDGEGVCELLEGISEEIDTLHNLLLDRMKLINLPMIFYNSGSFQTDLKFEPGTCKPVDGIPQDVIQVVQLPDTTFSIANEINWLVSQADRVVGVTPGVLGIQTAERPVAKETMALQEEANKKFKQHWDNARASIVEMTYRVMEGFAQYQPTYEFTDEDGVTEKVAMPTGNIRSYLEVKLEASTEQMNMEARRDVELMRYQALSDYMTKSAGMAQAMASPQVPSQFKLFLLQSNDIGARAMARFLSNFEDPEPETAVVDIRKCMDVQACIQNSIDIIQQQMAAQQQAAQQAEMDQNKVNEIGEGVENLPPDILQQMMAEMPSPGQGEQNAPVPPMR